MPVPSIARRRLRALLALVAAAGLAACQTVPAQGGFTRAQRAALVENGFVENGDQFELGLQDRLLFGFDAASLQPPLRARLVQLASALHAVAILGARVEGNTDSTGDAAYNVQLSLRRAQAVKRAMVEGGMPEASITAIGNGETNPIESNGTAQGREENRRVVIIVTPQDAG